MYDKKLINWIITQKLALKGEMYTLYLPSNTVLMCKTFFILASTNLFLINPEREQVQSR